MYEYAGRASARQLRMLLLSGAAALTLVSPTRAANAPANTAPASAKPTTAQERLVDINEYDVEGNTLLTPIEIQRAVYLFEGPKRPVSDTEKARAALEKVYADKGYQAVVVQLPPQSVHNGVVIIKVLEAKIGKVTVSGQKVTVSGQKYTTKGEVLDALPAIRSGQVPNFQDMNRELMALNGRSADLQVTPQLKPGAQPDTVDVDLAVNDGPQVHGGLELNNNYSESTHELRLQANLAYDDLWGLGHTLSGYYDVAPQDTKDASIYVGTYTAPIPDTSIRLSLTGLRSDSNVNTVGGTGVIGRGWSGTLGADAQLPNIGNYSQSLQVAVAYKHFTDVVSVTGQTDNAPVTYWPIALTYNGNWHGPQDTFSFSSALNFSIRGLGSNSTAFDAKRYDALPNYIYFRGSASEQHDFSFGPQLYLEADGQFSNEPLISNEEFSEGGNGSVRGYLQAEGLGDNGIHSSVELRTPQLAPYFKADNIVNDLRFFAFTDAARTWLISPLPEQQDDFSELGVGLGLRGKIKFINFEGDWGHALKDGVVSQAGEDRFYFRIYTNF